VGRRKQQGGHSCSNFEMYILFLQQVDLLEMRQSHSASVGLATVGLATVGTRTSDDGKLLGDLMHCFRDNENH
jgi:hypothetical protein